jgi:hypothetical protein
MPLRIADGLDVRQSQNILFAGMLPIGRSDTPGRAGQKNLPFAAHPRFSLCVQYPAET